MRIIAQEINDKENVDSDKIFNIEIEQLDFCESIFRDIAEKIRKCESSEDGLLTVQFSTCYSRIFNLIHILGKNSYTKEEALKIITMIKTEITYSENNVFDKYRKIFFRYFDKNSNFHQIKYLERCVDNLFKIVEKYKVDK